MTTIETKPKRTLNPIIKAMNDFRNNTISEHVGSKAPVKTAPIFKLALSAARLQMEIAESDKNTIEIVEKAKELFLEDPEKYKNLAGKESNIIKTKGKDKKLSVEVTSEEDTSKKPTPIKKSSLQKSSKEEFTENLS